MVAPLRRRRRRTRRCFGEGKGPARDHPPALSEDGKWLIVQSNVGSSSEQTRLWIRPAAGSGAFTVVSDTLHARRCARACRRPDLPAHELERAERPAHGRRRAQARHRELARVRARAQERRARGRVPGGRKLALRWLVNVTSQIEITGLDGTTIATVKLRPRGDQRHRANGAQRGLVQLSSLVRPQTIYRHDFATGPSTGVVALARAVRLREVRPAPWSGTSARTARRS